VFVDLSGTGILSLGIRNYFVDDGRSRLKNLAAIY
jgi:hypothetical protein